MSKIILIILILTLQILLFRIVINLILGTNNNNQKILNYANSAFIYSIIQNPNNYEIIIKNQTACDEPPCNDTTKIKGIDDKEDGQILKTLFEEIFIDKKTKEKTVNDINLTEAQLKIILDFLEKYAGFVKLKYEIIKDEDEDHRYYNDTYSERGYSYEIQNEGVIYTISIGQQPNIGYTIDISKVEISGNSAKICIEEGTPKEGLVYRDMIAYPIVQVKFNKLPTGVTVINEKARNIFPEVLIKKNKN